MSTEFAFCSPSIYICSIIVSFETLAENLVEQNDNFTNITLPGTNLVFQGTRVSTASTQELLLSYMYIDICIL